MHTYEQDLPSRPVRRRRRPHRPAIRRLGILPGCLLLILVAIFVTSLLEGCAHASIAEFSRSASTPKNGALFSAASFRQSSGDRSGSLPEGSILFHTSSNTYFTNWHTWEKPLDPITQEGRS